MECISLVEFKRILKNEVDLLSNLSHPNILKLIEYNYDGELVIDKSGKCIQIFFIVLELVESGDLFSYLEAK